MNGVDKLLEVIGGISTDENVDCSILGGFDNFFGEEAVQKEMIKMNQDRLYAEEGDVFGRRLGTYSSRVAKRKMEAGEPYHYYTYHDTGKTYDSLEIERIGKSYVDIVLEPYAPDYSHFLKESAWGLTDKQKEQLQEVLILYMAKFIRIYLNAY